LQLLSLPSQVSAAGVEALQSERPLASHPRVPEQEPFVLDTAHAVSNPWPAQLGRQSQGLSFSGTQCRSVNPPATVTSSQA